MSKCTDIIYFCDSVLLLRDSQCSLEVAKEAMKSATEAED